MCGIVGLLGFDEPGLVERMAQSIVHRGPDGEGFYRDREGAFAMGMRRLSIIDLEGGDQPIFNETGELAVCFNGEIYNYVELADELRARGHSFKTRSDTETIVHAYEEWGERCLERMNGMFAFALYDRRRRELFLARDRCGQKPLYYWAEAGSLVFASEVKAILLSSRVPRRCNTAAIDPYLALRYVPEPATMFEGIQTLPAGHFLRVRAGAAPRVERYWEIDLERRAAPRSDEEHLDEFSALLTDAVRLTMRSDVPVGAYLSAGVDSSLVTALMTKMVPNVQTFSIGFRSPIDETAAAARTAALLGTEHHEIHCTPADLALLPKVVYHMDRPVGDALIVAFYKLAECASQRVKAVISGEGADEMLAGYQFHKLISLVQRYQRVVPGWLDRGVALPLLRLAPVGLLDRFFQFPAGLGRQGKRRLVDFLSGYRRRDEFANSLALRTLWSQSERQTLYTGMATAEESWMPRVRNRGGPFLERLLKLQYDEWLQDWALIRQDKNAMAHSLEVRLPFLDHRLIEHVFALPARLKLRGLKDKVLERRLAQRVLPDEVARRPKNPFFLPMAFFFEHPQFRELLRTTLGAEQVRRRGYFDPDHVARLVARMQAGEFVLLKQVVSLVILELWHQVFIDRLTLW